MRFFNHKFETTFLTINCVTISLFFTIVTCSSTLSTATEMFLKLDLIIALFTFAKCNRLR